MMESDVAHEFPLVPFVVDAHVHLYSEYSVPKWLAAAGRNAGYSQSRAIPLLICVDRAGQSTLKRLQDAHKQGECSVEALCDDGSIIVVPKNGIVVEPSEAPPIHLVPGSQSVSREGLEVLGIGTWTRPVEREPALDQVRSILDAGGLPCVPWSPGKWLGKRGKMVRILFDTFGPHLLTVGDIALRTAWGPPSPLLHHARSSGFPVLLGTDPLPFSGEEDLVGSFGMKLLGPPPGHQGVVPWLIETLKDPTKVDGVHGERNRVMVGVRRFIRSNMA